LGFVYFKMFNAIKKIRECSSSSPVAEAEGTIMEEVRERGRGGLASLCHSPAPQTPRVDLWEFEASLLYITFSRPIRTVTY
jgi:hypothetical protein